MNKKLILNIVAKFTVAEALFMFVPVLVALYFNEFSCAGVFALITAVMLCVSVPFALIKPKKTDFYAKEGFAIISVTWIIMSLAGALCYYLTGVIPSYIDAVFETVSGYTTTGSSILTDIEILPKSVLFFRNFTNWIGGIGVLMLLMLFTPVSKHSIHLMRAELPGPTVGKLVPRGTVNAKIMYSIYIILTLVEIILLKFGGMPWFDSIRNSFATAGTGGFCPKNASIAHYNSGYIDWVISIFMILFGVNFNLYFYLLMRKFKLIYKNTELRVFISIIVTAIIILTFSNIDIFENILTSLRYSTFQVASIISSTGFATHDFNTWSEFSKSILVLLMLIGACAGSTGGGFKVSRIVLLFKIMAREFNKMIHPNAVHIVKVEDKSVHEETISTVCVYLIVYVLVIIISTIIIALDNFDFTTNLTAVITCMNNIGPGLEMVGPTGNFSQFSNLSKMVLSFNMLLGRLEFFPLLLVMSPKLWNKKFI